MSTHVTRLGPFRTPTHLAMGLFIASESVLFLSVVMAYIALRSGGLEAAKAELERVDAGESQADRWQLEQRIIHAENMLAVAGGADFRTARAKVSAGESHV